MADGSREQWKGDFLDVTGEVEEEPHQSRPMQLPRVGWGTDEGGGGDDDATTNSSHSSSTNSDNIIHPTDAGVPLPSINHDGGDVVVLRALSRNSEGELAPIPENMSMHGTWPDYYPDILGCYSDYDERKKYRYNRGCGSKFKWRICALMLFVFGAIIGSKVYTKMNSTKMAGKGQSKQQPSSPSLPQPSNTNGESDLTVGNTAAGDASSLSANNKKQLDKEQEQERYQYPPDIDIYQIMVDTLNPLMFDGSTSWDGTYFHAFEFCGAEYDRVPCPYIAYCPLGPGHAPLGGTKIDVDGSWAPIFNGSESNTPDWVQLGSDDTCELYSRLYDGHAPPWGNLVGEGDENNNGDNTVHFEESITRHVMCCLESVNGVYKGDDGKGILALNDPDRIDRPPGLEEDEVEKPIPIREEEEGDKGKKEENSEGR